MQLSLFAEVIYLVACTQQKVSGAVEAAELYMASQWFRKAREAAEMQADRWFIVSAHYALLTPDEIVSRYDAYAGDLYRTDKVRYDSHGFGPDGFYVDDWSETVVDELLRRESSGATVVILGSRLYTEALSPALEEAGFTVAAPLRGLGIGDQKQYLGWMAGAA